jgi:hypothetical protein
MLPLASCERPMPRTSVSSGPTKPIDSSTRFASNVCSASHRSDWGSSGRPESQERVRDKSRGERERGRERPAPSWPFHAFSCSPSCPCTFGVRNAHNLAQLGRARSRPQQTTKLKRTDETHARPSVRVRARAVVCMNVCAYARANMYVRMHECTYACVCVCARACECACACVRTCMRVCACVGAPAL